MSDIRRTLILSIIFLQALVWGCSKAPLPTDGNPGDNEKNETQGKIVVSSANYNGEPIDSASVFWDGQFIGYTPLASKKVQTGVHALRVQKKGYEIYFESITIENAQLVYVEALLKKLPLNKGQLLITIDQDSAKTILTNSQNDVVDLFYTREKTYVLDPGGYFLKTEKSGFRLVHLALEIKADSIIVKNIRLEKIFNPELPVIALAVSDSGRVNEPILISWESNNAEKVDIDYIQNPGLSGKREIIFNTPGMRSIQAIAHNKAGMSSVIDSVYIYEPGTRPKNPPSLEFYVTPDSVEYEQPVQVTWNSSSYQVIIDQGIGVRGSSGTEEVLFINPGVKVFTAVAYGENETTTIKKDTVLIKYPVQPKLPIIVLAVLDSVQVGMPVTIEWHTQNAYRVDVDYVQSSGLNGKAEVVFQSEGQRIITATAYNQAGQVTVADTLQVVFTPPQQPQVAPLIVIANAKVGAIHPALPQVIYDIGPAEIKQEGYYRITAAVWYNSGDDQKNESFFIVIADEFRQKIYPRDPNAGIYKVVPDDPGPPHIADRDAGLFYLSPGQITSELHHYYTISDQYPQFIFDGATDDAESVEVINFKFEFCYP